MQRDNNDNNSVTVRSERLELQTTTRREQQILIQPGRAEYWSMDFWLQDTPRGILKHSAARVYIPTVLSILLVTNSTSKLAIEDESRMP